MTIPIWAIASRAPTVQSRANRGTTAFKRTLAPFSSQVAGRASQLFQPNNALLDNCRNQAITLKCPAQGQMSVMAILHQLTVLALHLRVVAITAHHM